ncbi:acyl-CoA carboxylase epsilon subunit [Citricoccus sp. GCM10030269]|uniref:acyl-CoA carboxylase epsilon subunit n=1 Tax=Citricoccus sp. GCM10030269 TaxID=3273388 RepID=UPI00360D7B23
MSRDPQSTDSATEPVLVIKGSLDAEETAALAAVLQAVAVQAEHHRRESAGRHDRDRTLDRRRRLGLWARPGSDSWKHAAGRN